MNKPKVADPALHVAIDAINIRQGGGVTHLTQLLAAADPLADGVARVTVWTCAATARQLQARPWLTVRTPAWAEAALPLRIFGQQWRLGREMRQARCDVVFSPGGTLPADAPGVGVTMSQNMLPFEPQEAALFGRFSAMRLKMWLLRRALSRSFRKASGVVFLTRYAQDSITSALGLGTTKTALIPHGIEQRFLQPPRPVRKFCELSFDQPFELVYVSILMPYKHQLEVIEGVRRLRAAGVPVRLTLVGAPWGRYGRKVLETCRRQDPEQTYVKPLGNMSFAALHAIYGAADGAVFASSCENLPNILIEAMASGLPNASSGSGPMPEVLRDAGIYFNARDPDSIAATLRTLIEDEQLRTALAARGHSQAAQYSWARCASETFRFIREIAQRPTP